MSSFELGGWPAPEGAGGGLVADHDDLRVIFVDTGEKLQGRLNFGPRERHEADLTTDIHEDFVDELKFSTLEVRRNLLNLSDGEWDI